MQLSHLEAKRSALEKSLEQLVGQINRVNGALAVVDELITEQRARDVVEEQARDATINYGGMDRSPSPHWNAVADEAPSLAPAAPEEAHAVCAVPTAPEMLPVLPEEWPPANERYAASASDAA